MRHIFILSILVSAILYAKSANQVYRMPPTGQGNIAAFGQLALSSSAAVVGLLPETNGGTGNSSYTVGGIVFASNNGALVNTVTGTAGQVLTSTGTAAPNLQTVPGNTTILKAPTVQRFTATGTTSGYVFTITTISSNAGCVYSNNANNYTVLQSVNPGTTLFTSGTGTITGSTLTAVTGGSGCSNGGNITFSASQALATYTLPTNPSPISIRVTGIGGGGGGGGVGGSTDAGTAGGTTYFGTNFIIAGGGGFGFSSAGSGAANGGGGGTCSGTVLGNLINGGYGGSAVDAVTNNYSVGANGCSSPFGGGGGGGAGTTNGVAAASNSGSGGGGAGGSISSGDNALAASAGGCGCWFDTIITNPNSIYYYSIAAGGSGGGGSEGGGAGAAGRIIVEERYQ